MAVTYNRPEGLKYTDMCIYIDANIDKILNEGEHPEIESRIFEYLYHILYALSCKANFFRSFEDYDSFALYGAGEVYLCLRKKYMNAGKEVRGKVVEPIKSCLNYIKSVLFPMKVNYQRIIYHEVFNPEANQDTSIIESDLKNSVRSDYLPDFQDTITEIFTNFKSKIYKNILLKTPYRRDKVFLKKIYMSCLLTLLYQWTLPQKLLTKLEKKSDSNYQTQFVKNVQFQDEIVLWHLDEKYKDYVHLQVNKIKNFISREIEDTRVYYDLQDEVVDNILKTAYSTYDDNVEGEF